MRGLEGRPKEADLEGEMRWWWDSPPVEDAALVELDSGL